MLSTMNLSQVARSGALLAINLQFLMVWGFSGIGKLNHVVPAWFGDKFGKTFLASFPGLPATFWLLTATEMLGFLLAVGALIRGEFLRLRPASCLLLLLTWSLFTFLMLAFGLWLTGDFNGTFQQFVYFSLTLVALQYAGKPMGAMQEGNHTHPR